MNHLKFLCYAFVFFGLTIASCGKDDSSDSDSDRTNYFFCKLDGNDWEAVSIMQPTITTTATSKRFDMFGSDPDGPTISLIVQDYENPGSGCLTESTYYGEDHTNASANFTNSSGEMNFTRLTVTGAGTSSKDGLVRITKCEDGKISGTFEFLITDLAGDLVHTISEGRFDNVAF